MKTPDKISKEMARQVGQTLHVNFETIGLLAFQDAMNIEWQREINEGEIDMDKEIPKGKLKTIGTIVLSHINQLD